jgi:hypothetical protein
MCIFSGAVTHVANTKILVGIVYPSSLQVREIGGAKKGVKIPDYSSPFQLTVYSNQVGLGGETPLEESLEVSHRQEYQPAMVLPFPLKKGANRIKILDFSKYAKIFEDLDLLFPHDLEGATRSQDTYSFSNSIKDEAPLEIHYVGSYQASIVPNWESFDRLQYNHFNLSPDTKELLGRYYRRGFGFMVCQLTRTARDDHQYHPFAYIHEIREDHRLFIPTRHYHKHVDPNPYAKYHTLTNPNPRYSALSSRSESEEGDDLQEVQDMFMKTLTLEDRFLEIHAKKNKMTEDRAAPAVDWDHEIYVVNFPRVLQNPLLQNKPGVRIIEGNKNRIHNVYTYLDSTLMPKEIAFGKIKFMFKIKITPVYKYNHDILV